MQWVEVVDSAVKIGLGAAITAVSAYFMLRRTQAGEFQKELRERRWKMLEDVAEKVQEAYRTHLDHLHALTNLEDLDDDTPSDVRARVKGTMDSLGTRLVDQMQSLSAAEAKLLLLGEKDAHQKCRYFHDALTTHLLSKTDKLAGTSLDDATYAHDPEKWRKEVFQSLGDIYKRM